MKYLFTALGGYFLGALPWQKPEEFPWMLFTALMCFSFGGLFAWMDSRN